MVGWIAKVPRVVGVYDTLVGRSRSGGVGWIKKAGNGVRVAGVYWCSLSIAIRLETWLKGMRIGWKVEDRGGEGWGTEDLLVCRRAAQTL